MKRILTALAALALVAGSARPGARRHARRHPLARHACASACRSAASRSASATPRTTRSATTSTSPTLLAEKLGVPVEFTDVSGDARISMLVSGQLDIVVANTSATLERAKTRQLHHPLQPRRPARHRAEGFRHQRRSKDLAGKKVVVGRGTTGETFIKKAVPNAELVYVDQFAPDGVLQLQQKRVDAAIEDSSLLDYLATKNPSLVTLPGLYSNDPISIAVAKGDPEFVRWLDMFVSDYIQSGAYEANYKKWWGENRQPAGAEPAAGKLEGRLRGGLFQFRMSAREHEARRDSDRRLARREAVGIGDEPHHLPHIVRLVVADGGDRIGVEIGQRQVVEAVEPEAGRPVVRESPRGRHRGCPSPWRRTCRRPHPDNRRRSGSTRRHGRWR